MKNALIIVDVQNDFLPGGALAVTDGDAIIPVINGVMADFDLVIATQDWHPPDHGSFAATHGKRVGETIDLDGLDQFLWPTHCVQGTSGAEFASDLDQSSIDRVFQKGTNLKVDSYSGFYDNAKRYSTGLAEYLREQGVKNVTVVGLATDYCVKFTVLDALSEQFRVTVIKAACRGVNINPGDVDAALNEMSQAGAILV